MNRFTKVKTKISLSRLRNAPFSAFTANRAFSLKAVSVSVVSVATSVAERRRPSTRLACAHPRLHNRPPTPHTSRPSLLPPSSPLPRLQHRQIGSERGAAIALDSRLATHLSRSDYRIITRGCTINLAMLVTYMDCNIANLVALARHTRL